MHYRGTSVVILTDKPSNIGKAPVRILVAEDNPSVRGAMRSVLEHANENWQIIEAGDGAEAVERTKEFRPDLIILDLVMPAMDGFDAAREIVRLAPQIPILLHTMFSSPMVDLEALTIGVKKVVAKSESGALVSAVRELLRPNPATSTA